MNSVVITGTGRYEPTIIVENEEFLNRQFFNEDGSISKKDVAETVRKFEELTNIKKRKYLAPKLVTSDMAAVAANKALRLADIADMELNKIIVAHNFGDVKYGSTQSDFVPSLASRVKNKLGMLNPSIVAQDLNFGCPGWLEGVINAYKDIKDNPKGKALVIGAESLSRVSDPFDIDSMIYADGAGAVVLETIDTPEKMGIISHLTHTYAVEGADMLTKGSSYKPGYMPSSSFLKMNGHDVYLFAIDKVPKLIKEHLDNSGISPSDISKVVIHQANQKMDEKILQKLKRKYKGYEFNKNLMPMIIENYGNSSVATIPTLFDLMARGELSGHDDLKKGDLLLFTSIGAGMNINSMLYRLHQDLADYRNN